MAVDAVAKVNEISRRHRSKAKGLKTKSSRQIVFTVLQISSVFFSLSISFFYCLPRLAYRIEFSSGKFNLSKYLRCLVAFDFDVRAAQVAIT